MFFDKFRHYILTRILSDKMFLRYRYYSVFRKHLSFSNPKTLNEKIQWLKINDRKSINTKVADKLLVRDYVSECGLAELLIPLYGEFSGEKTLTINDIPNVPCVIKVNNNSGGVFICNNKEQINIDELNSGISLALKKNHYHHTKEWQYKNIKPAILIEKMLQDSSGDIPPDFKVHCINGVAKFLQIDSDRNSNHNKIYLNRELKECPFTWGPIVDGKEKIGKSNIEDIDIPKSTAKLFELSEMLAKPFSYCRVDFYICDEVIYFGEITLHHGSGFSVFNPADYDMKIGSELKL